MMLRAALMKRLPLAARRDFGIRSLATNISESSGSGSSGRMQAGDRELPPNEAWRKDSAKYPELQRLPGGRQPQKDFKMGPYAAYMRVDPKTKKVTPVGVFFVSPRKDPVTFVVNFLCVCTVIWCVSQLSWGESFFEKRRRVIRERIRQEYGLPKGWEHDIEEDELALSDTVPTGSVSTPTPAAQ
mmetsp:Transcript_52204/g.124446  ORF Transcript_52204/g.124446 Transcript_52204/m.124446 type:complete len:185 (+) Transcript_52204:111-665(+)